MINFQQSLAKRKTLLSRSPALRDNIPSKRIYNIFEINDPLRRLDFKQLSPQSPYHIVGDNDLRQKILLNKTVSQQDVDKDQRSQLTSICQQNKSLNSLIGTTPVPIKNTSRLTQLPSFDYMSRISKTRNSLEDYQKKWESIPLRLIGQNKEPVKVRVFIQENPEKKLPINPSSCEIWKKTLRNEKRLLKHIERDLSEHNLPLQTSKISNRLPNLSGEISMSEEFVPKQGFALQGKQYKSRSFSQNSRASKYNVEQVFKAVWENRHLQRMHHHF